MTKRKLLGAFVGAVVMGSMLMGTMTTSAEARGWKRSYPNMVEALEKDGRFGTLLVALEVAGLKETVATGGPFTLFAPTDDAFAALPAGTVEALVGDPETLAQILLYHVVGSSQSRWELLRESTVATLQGDSVLVLREGYHLTVNGQNMVGHIGASNGRIYAIDGVLLPPSEPAPVESIIDVLELDGRFGTLLTALDVAGLTETVATAGPFTLFAPTDEAFAALPEGTVEALVADPETLAGILLYHVVAGERSARSLLWTRGATTVQGDDVNVTYTSEGVKVNDSIVLNANINAPNGVIHAIGSVLLPPAPTENLLEFLKADGRFTTLVTALELTGLDEAVANGEALTVFAPTDEAFGRLPEGTLEALIADPETLSSILLYHVVGGSQTASDLLSERSVETLQGADVHVRKVWWRYVFVNNAYVLDANLEAPNGIVHAINSVLIPPTE